MVRALLSLSLSLVLLVTSQSAAVARGAPHAVDQILICSGTSVITVFVDADGQPTEATHLCPDCALHLLAALVPPITAVTQVIGLSTQLTYPAQLLRDGANRVSASARAPPLNVIPS